MAPDDNERTESMGGFDQEPDRPRIKRLGHFKIEATLGSGGMGTIYRAYDESMKRPVALKVLHSSLGISERAQSRFVREAWIAGQLDHPNIIKVFSRGEENNVSYLALELAEGGSLSDLVEQTRESIPSGCDVTDTVGQDYIKDILVKFVELAGALEHIHSKGFIHRDIKPQNVLLSGADRKFKLTDFGIAHAKDMTRMTQAGDFIGTVRYMSPELLAAHRAGIDNRTDIYSLGVTLYEALTLTLPFKADSEEKLIGEILAGHCIEARKFNRRIPVDLETVLMKACNHDPDLRYQTASEFADDLQRIIDGRPVLAKRQGVVSKGVKYVRRNYKAVLTVAAALVVLVSVILLSYYKLEQAYRGKGDELARLEMGHKPEFTKISIPTYPGNGVLSPDGERLAFASDRTIWIVPLHGKVDPDLAGEPVKLTDRIGAWNRGPISTLDWSRDGRWIAFNVSVNDTTDKIFVVPADGGNPNAVPIEIHRGNWLVNYRLSLSPDGRRLAYSSADEPLSEPHFGPPLSRLFIRTVLIEGGEEVQVTSVPSREPAFSPDGEKIAFIAGGRSMGLADTTDRWFDRPNLAVYVVDARGGEPVLVADLPGWESYPIWSSDGRMIAFSYCSEEDKYEIGIVPVLEDGSPEADPILIEPPTQDFKLAGWSTKGQIGICSVEPEHFAIYTVPASGGRAVQITPEGRADHPRWTPDGSRIFYYTESREVAWVPAEGGKPEVIPSLSADSKPRFHPHYYGPGIAVSPDGSSLVVSGTKEGIDGAHIWIMSSEGGEPRQITSSPASFEDGFPCWSPGGDSIAFARFRYSDDGSVDQCNIFVVSVEGGEPRQVTVDEDSVALSVIAWSPDGEIFAFRSYHPTAQNRRAGLIKTISVNGGASKIVTEVKRPYVHTSLSWSPDGTRLAYDYDQKSIQIVSLDDSTVTEVKTGLEDGRPYCVSWSPDGEKIAFAAYRTGEESFYLMDRFLPLSQPTRPEPPTEPTFSMIKAPGLLDYCALSPDGQRIAFVASDSCLWVALTRGSADTTVAGEAMRLTDPLGAYPLFCLPVWSADGNWIAFNANTLDSASSYWASMYVIASTGGELIEVPVKHDCIRSVRFWDLRTSLAPDGKNIAFFSHSSPIPGDSGGDCIYAMPIRGGEITRLADSLCGYPFYCGQPAYSPDGEMLAFLRGDQYCGLVNDSAGCNIWVVPVEGGSPVQTTSLPGVEFGPVWSPDGKRIAFSQWTETEIKDVCEIRKLFIVSLSEKYQPLAPLESIDLPLPSDDFIGGWSTDGEIGLVLETAVHMAIYTISASGGIPTMIRPSFSHCPSWSPDGERIFYLTENDVYSAPTVGGQESRIPIAGIEDLGFEGGCDLSPGGDRLVFRGLREGDSTPHLYTVPANGGEPKQITFDSSDDWFPCWSPDANWIAFSRSASNDDNESHLCVVSADGGEIIELVAAAESSGFSDGKADWSPDGKFIAYPSYHGDSLRGLSLVPFDGGNSELILTLETGRGPLYVKWSPDGQKLAYTSYGLENGKLAADIWILPLDTRKPHRLQMTGYDLDAALEADWSPDGERIVFTGRRASRNTLCLIKNFLPDELTQR